MMSVWSVVTDDSMLYYLPWFCLVHTVDSCANEGWFSCDEVILRMCFVCRVVNIEVSSIADKVLPILSQYR